MQTRRHSLYESLITTTIGLGYAVPLNYVMIHEMVWSDPWIQSIAMTVVFTNFSILLKYIMRRIFNAITLRQAANRLNAISKAIEDPGPDPRYPLNLD